MLRVKEALQNYLDDPDNDETGTNGLWDYAGELVISKAGDMALSDSERELWQQAIYEAMESLRTGQVCSES